VLIYRHNNVLNTEPTDYGASKHLISSQRADIYFLLISKRQLIRHKTNAHRLATWYTKYRPPSHNGVTYWFLRWTSQQQCQSATEVYIPPRLFAATREVNKNHDMKILRQTYRAYRTEAPLTRFNTKVVFISNFCTTHFNSLATWSNMALSEMRYAKSVHCKLWYRSAFQKSRDFKAAGIAQSV